MWLMAAEQLIHIDVATAWNVAREKAAISQDALAAFMGIKTSQLADQLAGRGHLSFQRVSRIAQDPDGLVFLRFFILGCAAQIGLDLDALFRVTQLERMAVRLISRYESRALRSAGTSKERIS